MIIVIALNMPFWITKPGSYVILRDKSRICLKEVVQVYEKGKRLLSILQAAKLYVISKITLYNRIYGHQNQTFYGVSKQRLIPEEEKLIKSWVLNIQLWRFFLRVSQLQEMAEELLQARGDYKELGINKISGFFT